MFNKNATVGTEIFPRGVRKMNQNKLIEISGGAEAMAAGTYIKGGGGPDNQGCHFAEQ